MKTIVLALIACAALAACSTKPPAEPVVRIVEKLVPMPTPCVSDKTPPAPAYKVTIDGLRAEPSKAKRYVLAVGGLIEREQRLAETEPVIEACRK